MDIWIFHGINLVHVLVVEDYGSATCRACVLLAATRLFPAFASCLQRQLLKYSEYVNYQFGVVFSFLWPKIWFASQVPYTEPILMQFYSHDDNPGLSHS